MRKPFKLLWLPNLITLGRLLAVPVLVYFVIQEQYGWAFWTFVIAGVSDAVDGALARAWNARSAFGAYVDPLADKALLLAAYVSLGHVGYIGDWLVILVVFRDVLILGGIVVVHLLTHTVRMRPIFISKINTLFQILFVAFLLARLGLGLDIRWLTVGLMWTVAVTTVVSGAAYVMLGMRQTYSSEGS